MSQVPALQRAPRGAASVEMALCMLVIIPVFLYALFLDDLLRYSLDVQEATVSTMWDYTVQDYAAVQRKARFNPWNVQHYARLMFCDHESGKNRYDDITAGGKFKDCAEEDHHQGTALTAHVCWINGDAKQVTCEGPDASVGDLGADGLHAGYATDFNHGGLIQCSARAVVENYLLPKQFLPEFSDGKEKVDLSKERWRGSGYHENAEKGDKTTAYFIKEQRMAILVDTWALTRPADVRPGEKKGELYERVERVYSSRQNPGYAQMERGAMNFFSRARNSLLNPSYVPPTGGDDPRTPNLSIKPHLRGMETPSERIRQENSNSYYFNTEWRDWDQDRNRKTYQKRGEHYLGCQRPEDCG